VGLTEAYCHKLTRVGGVENGALLDRDFFKSLVNLPDSMERIGVRRCLESRHGGGFLRG
jgi:hypothetical protein